MTEHRYWTNESGVVHRVADWEETPSERSSARIRTACGLEYRTAKDVRRYDPDELDAAVPQVYRCGNCDWGDGDE